MGTNIVIAITNFVTLSRAGLGRNLRKSGCDQSGQRPVERRRVRQVPALAGARHQTKTIAVSGAVDDTGVGAVPGDLLLGHSKDARPIAVEFVFPARQPSQGKPT